jgi:hypothetical protein
MKKKIIWFVVLYILYMPLALAGGFLIPYLLHIESLFLAVILSILFVGGPILYFCLMYDQPNKEQKQILLNGIEALAQVNYIKDTGVSIGNFNRLVLLGLTVFDKEKTFETEAEAQYNKYMLPRPGDKIKVKYDLFNKTRIVVIDDK